ncbi:putative 2-aminoethylphosphonate ABC transporter ATP-binding protein [Roseococcus thiosulfatophilus]|uniref:putative 2-aminoethylphosphonate ABC transporter ATP-binding protein n=1 Tax=Roseococcus thiosulfatophilus TaxID=35813 RepID=UPI001A8EDEA6|nr:putative 2-aminoethylphosphonate ABC transporter ATP-binding protein [Roseococcus thiosulfatophilus]
MDLAARAVAAGIYLTVQEVTKRFGRFVALDRVSLEVREGEFVSFLGPSGCGKTTLLRAIAGLDPPSEGRIVQAGRDITHLPPGERDFGIVFQSYALFPNLDMRANIGYGLRGPAWPRAKAAARVEQLIAMVGLEEHARKYPAQLSGGQQQRVALARALANHPGLLLLDEPLSALDATVRARLRTEIRALQKALGVTTIMVTHDQEEALSVSDRIVVMREGRIEQIGTPEEVYRRPATAFVAGFVGRTGSFRAEVEHPHAATPRLRAGPVSLAATAAASLSPGEAAHAFIRPEDVRLGDDALGHEGAFQAVVTGVEFLGPVCRVHLLAEGVALEAELPSSEIGKLGLGHTARLWVAVPAERIMTYPDA